MRNQTSWQENSLKSESSDFCLNFSCSVILLVIIAGLFLLCVLVPDSCSRQNLENQEERNKNSRVPSDGGDGVSFSSQIVWINIVWVLIWFYSTKVSKHPQYVISSKDPIRIIWIFVFIWKVLWYSNRNKVSKYSIHVPSMFLTWTEQTPSVLRKVVLKSSQ